MADDDDEMREVVASALGTEGYDVTAVADGGRLLVLLASTYLVVPARETYDLFVSDLRMPICSGLDILEQLRGARWKIPAILMTAFGDASLRARAKAAGALLLIKPFPLDALVTAARNLVVPTARPRSPLI